MDARAGRARLPLFLRGGKHGRWGDTQQGNNWQAAATEGDAAATKGGGGGVSLRLPVLVETAPAPLQELRSEYVVRGRL